VIRRLFTTVVVLAVLAVLADRGAELVAARLVADRTQRAADLASRPSVTIRGFPFLTQVVRGRYQEIDVTAHDVTVGGLRFATVAVRLSGVRIELGHAVRGQVRAVPVRAGSGSAFLAFADLDGWVAAHGLPLSVEPGPGDQVRVSGSVSVLGQRLSAHAAAAVSVLNGELVLTPVGVGSALVAALTVRVPVSELPLGVALTGVTVQPGGLQFSAQSSGLDIPVTG
jgi:hypothetical protein